MQIIMGHQFTENFGVVPPVQQSGIERLRLPFVWTQTRTEQSFQKTWRQTETKGLIHEFFLVLSTVLARQSSCLAHLEAKSFYWPPELSWTFRTLGFSRSLWKAGVSVCPLSLLSAWPCPLGCHCLLLSQPMPQGPSGRIWSFPSKHRAAPGTAKWLPPVEYTQLWSIYTANSEWISSSTATPILKLACHQSKQSSVMLWFGQGWPLK